MQTQAQAAWPQDCPRSARATSLWDLSGRTPQCRRLPRRRPRRCYRTAQCTCRRTCSSTLLAPHWCGRCRAWRACRRAVCWSIRRRANRTWAATAPSIGTTRATRPSCWPCRNHRPSHPPSRCTPPTRAPRRHPNRRRPTMASSRRSSTRTRRPSIPTIHRFVQTLINTSLNSTRSYYIWYST